MCLLSLVTGLLAIRKPLVPSCVLWHPPVLRFAEHLIASVLVEGLSHSHDDNFVSGARIDFAGLRPPMSRNSKLFLVTMLLSRMRLALAMRLRMAIICRTLLVCPLTLPWLINTSLSSETTWTFTALLQEGSIEQAWAILSDNLEAWGDAPLQPLPFFPQNPAPVHGHEFHGLQSLRRLHRQLQHLLTMLYNQPSSGLGSLAPPVFSQALETEAALHRLHAWHVRTQKGCLHEAPLCTLSSTLLRLKFVRKPRPRLSALSGRIKPPARKANLDEVRSLLAEIPRPMLCPVSPRWPSLVSVLPFPPLSTLLLALCQIGC